MIACPNCGGNLKFDPATQKMRCAFCDSEFSPEEVQEEHEAQAQEAVPQEPREELPPEETYSAFVFTCPQCGGELISYDDTAATFCSFCGASNILESRLSDQQKPKMVIPFALSKEACEAAYRKKISASLFAPDSFKEDSNVENFRGIYMPYWVYNLHADHPIEMKGKTEQRKGDYIYTRHYKLRGNLRAHYDGISYDASSSFSDALSSAIAPFDIKGAVPFQSNYLSGFYADTADVSSQVYLQESRGAMEEDLKSAIRKTSAFRKYTIPDSDVRRASEADSVSSERAMFPVWFLSTRVGDRISYAVVNGQTGKVAADIPVSYMKYLIGSLIIAVPVFLALTFNTFIRPSIITTIAMGVALVSLIISNSQLNRIAARENRLDDKGYTSTLTPSELKALKENNGVTIKSKPQRSAGDTVKAGVTSASVTLTIIGVIFLLVMPIIGIALLVAASMVRKEEGKDKTLVKTGKEKIKVKASASQKMKVLWKPLCGILIALSVLSINPVSDLYYWAGALVSMFFVGWSFWDVVQEHNMLSTRKLPQFNRRGGDESEH
ncbi:MAG: hypothetical protein K5891_12350 [Lachnospiraceae bacterium]|nr:hypothetical protein [Lachnospiraceae bacterium]